MAAATTLNRPSSIQTLIDGIEIYNPENKESTPILESYLAEQCKDGHYDLQANLAILRVYQSNPSLANDSVIANILAKALTAIPAPDFNLCLYLLHDHKEPIQRLTKLQQLLESSRYAEFWKAYKEDTSLTASVVGFEDAIREKIASVVSKSHQTINATTLSSYLALSDNAFQQFCASHEWQESNGLVIIPVNKDNEAKAILVRENIKFEQLSKVIGSSYEM